MLRYVQLFELLGRSREGAWIEIESIGTERARHQVAPVRERGLKFK